MSPRANAAGGNAGVDDALIREVLRDYPLVWVERIERLGSGLINDTYAVEADGASFVCQRVHPVFSPEIHLNIAAVTEHLDAKGVATPRLVPDREGRAFVTRDERVWRLMTRLRGVSFDTAIGPHQVAAAGRALAMFHSALTDLDHTFVGLRAGVHDTSAHLARLRDACATHQSHSLFARVEPLAAEILEAAARLPLLAAVPDRCMHGDPKFNNVLFAGTHGSARETAVGLIDLDTVGPMGLHLELGDAWRSWCNPCGEDDRSASFDLATYEASLRGWAGAISFEVSAAEREALGISVELITLELAARFCADALLESYFGWDPTRFSTRGEHNLLRAQGQWALHQAARACRDERLRLLDEVLGA